MANPEPFDPMEDLARAIQRARRARAEEGAQTDAQADDGPRAPGDNANVVAGVASITIFHDREHGVYDGNEDAGGVRFVLASSAIPEEMNAHGLGVGILVQSLLYTPRGWVLTVDQDSAPDDPDSPIRTVVIPLSRITHAMWHALNGSRCSDRTLLALPGDLAGRRDKDGRSAFEHVRAAFGMLEDWPTLDDTDLRAQAAIRSALAKALELMDVTL